MFNLLEDSELNQVYAFKALRSFALGLISVFIPVYLVQQGLTIQGAFIYMASNVGAFAIVALPVGYILSRIGDRKGMMFSYLFYLPGFLILEFFSASLSAAIAVGVLLGVGEALYWIPINSGFTAGSSSDSRGSDYGRLMGLGSLAGALAPLIGGIILSSYSFSILILAAIFFVVASALPLAFSRGRDPDHFSLSDVTSLKNLELDLMFFFVGMTAFSLFMVLPLFVFFVIGGEINVGAVKTLVGLSSALFSVLIGEISDRTNRFRLIFIGTFGTAFALVWLTTVSTAVLAFFLSALFGFLYRTYHVPLFSMVADIGDRGNKLGFYSLREVFLGLGRFIMLGISAVVIFLKGPMAGFKVSFYISAVSILIAAYLSLRVERRIL
jgi:MFS family permease